MNAEAIAKRKAQLEAMTTRELRRMVDDASGIDPRIKARMTRADILNWIENVEGLYEDVE